jgi:uncharacterized protein
VRNAVGNAFVLVLAVVLLLGGGLLAWAAQTEFGQVRVERLRLARDDGAAFGARLYRPPSATVSEPAPAVLLVHGFGAEEGALAPYGLELARRGYVVLAADRPGHGRSAPAPEAAGVGADDALTRLRSFDFVDGERFALLAHGIGSEAVLDALEEGVWPRAIVLLGTAPRADTADPAALPNVAVVHGRYDEFTESVWGVPTATRLVGAPRLQELFDLGELVVPGAIYGSLDDGTGRVFYRPPVLHQGLLQSGAAIAPVIDWLQRAMPPSSPLPPNDQVWVGWAVGSGLMLLGYVFALFGISGVLLGTLTFGEMRLRLAPAAGLRGAGWWLAALVATAVPALTYFWAFEHVDELLRPVVLGGVPLGDVSVLPQPLTTGLAGWALLNGGVALVLVLSWWVVAGRRRGARSDTLGLHVGGFGRAALFALLVVGLAQTLLALASALFQVDARAWVVVVMPPERSDATALAVYLVPFVLAFAVAGMLLHGQLRPLDSRHEGADAMIANAFILAGGLLVLLVTQYVPLLGDGVLPFGEPLLTVLAIEVAAVLAVAATLSTYLFVRTGSVWPGALVNGAWVATYLVASGVTAVGP